MIVKVCEHLTERRSNRDPHPRRALGRKAYLSRRRVGHSDTVYGGGCTVGQRLCTRGSRVVPPDGGAFRRVPTNHGSSAASASAGRCSRNTHCSSSSARLASCGPVCSSSPVWFRTASSATGRSGPAPRRCATRRASPRRWTKCSRALTAGLIPAGTDRTRRGQTPKARKRRAIAPCSGRRQTGRSAWRRLGRQPRRRSDTALKAATGPL